MYLICCSFHEHYKPEEEPEFLVGAEFSEQLT